MVTEELKKFAEKTPIPDPVMAQKAHRLLLKLCDTTNPAYYIQNKDQSRSSYSAIECTSGNILRRIAKPTEKLYLAYNPFLFNKRASLYAYDGTHIPEFLKPFTKPIEQLDKKLAKLPEKAKRNDYTEGDIRQLIDHNIITSQEPQDRRPCDILDLLQTGSEFNYVSKDDNRLHAVECVPLFFEEDRYKERSFGHRMDVSFFHARDNYADVDYEYKLHAILYIDDVMTEAEQEMSEWFDDNSKVNDKRDLNETVGDLWYAYMAVRDALYGHRFRDCFFNWFNLGINSWTYAVRIESHPPLDLAGNPKTATKVSSRNLDVRNIWSKVVVYKDFLNETWSSRDNDFRSFVYTKEFAKLARQAGCDGYSANESICDRLAGIRFKAPTKYEKS